MSTTPLLSDLLTQQNRTTESPAIPLTTPNWQLNQIISRAAAAIDLKVVAVESAIAIMDDPAKLREYCAKHLADIKQLTAESRAAAAVMRSKSRTGFVNRLTSPVSPPTSSPTDEAPTIQLDEFGERK